MKKLLLVLTAFGIPLLFCLSLFLAACTPDDLKGNAATGEWDPGAGLNYPFSFRNHRYTFNVTTDGGALDITLKSPDSDVALWLYNPLGQLIGNTWGDRTLNLTADNLNSGKYLVIAGTTNRGDKGTYTLEVTGDASSLTRIPSQNLPASGAWDTEGGGVNYPFSFRNHRYTVEVTEENSVLDVILESTGADGALWIYNPLGQLIGNTWGDRSLSVVKEAPQKGTYTIIAGTTEREVLNATYVLNVNGQVANLNSIPSQQACANGNIANGAGVNMPNSSKNDVYTFQVTKDNSSIDLILRSPSFDIAVWVYNPLGQLIGNTWGDRDLAIIKDAGIGTYRVVYGTTNVGEGGAYSICVVGQIANFQKQ